MIACEFEIIDEDDKKIKHTLICLSRVSRPVYFTLPSLDFTSTWRVHMLQNPGAAGETYISMMWPVPSPNLVTILTRPGAATL